MTGIGKVILILLGLAAGGCSIFFTLMLAGLGEGLRVSELLSTLPGYALGALFLWLALRKR